MILTSNEGRRKRGLPPAAVQKAPHTDPQSDMKTRAYVRRTSTPFSISLKTHKTSERPPQLTRVRPIPLPPVSTIPILIHPLLHHHTTSTPIVYDLSMTPSTAHAPMTKNHEAYRHWRSHSAIEPNVGSITIRISGVARPVVVLPSRRDITVVTIEDILDAVYRAIRTAAMDYDVDQRQDEGQGIWGAPRNKMGGHTDEHVTARIRSYMRRRCWWAGIYPSRTERDVWIMYTDAGRR